VGGGGRGRVQTAKARGGENLLLGRRSKEMLHKESPSTARRWKNKRCLEKKERRGSPARKKDLAVEREKKPTWIRQKGFYKNQKGGFNGRKNRWDICYKNAW